MEARPFHGGFVIWITGMQGAGKTTLAGLLAKKLTLGGRQVETMDADDPGQILTKGLGASKEDRDTAVRRVGHVAKLLVRHGAPVVVAALSPYREPREQLRRELRRFVEVFVDCRMETLLTRSDLYKRALAGEIQNVPGVQDPYEPPSHPEVLIHSDAEKPEAAALRVLQALVDLKLVAPAEFARITGGQRPRRGKAERAKPARSSLRRGARKAAPRAVAAARRARTRKRR